MNIVRHEIRTGLLVVVTLAALVTVLVYLGAPGAFIPQHHFGVFFDNAAGIKPGAAVMLAGRKIGQVSSLKSPVPEKDRPDPRMETLIEVQVTATSDIFRKVRVQMTQNNLLGESVIDFTNGDESSGLAPDHTNFVGERPGNVADAVPLILSRIDPAIAKVNATLGSLQKTADNLTRMTTDGADLPVAAAEMRKFSANLEELTSQTGALHHTLNNIDVLTADQGKLSQSFGHLAALTSPDGPLSKTLQNTEKLTSNLAANKDIDATLKNLRTASAQLDRTLNVLTQKFSAVGDNLEQASDTVKRQPWRLIWPTTKKYPAVLPAAASETVGRKSENPPHPRPSSSSSKF